ncbi:metal ABC transporter permease [Syntrophorhabdus aromaticivorans]|uniref:Metal ABC transporter permease n=1 Tax=Syntrophorhabdus aromaticivorans TaxID=328301 RepID=A0A351U3U5_9BACT|nr:metal ABC transporter permease [Syntrophorhabdus aromaticivorans]NLW35619.1 metal ABC transporter permease [Syntrophorhabdus aromaticivorans]HBA54626.1 metal ABC transporter permease [Syntrophorhabdus aromaticivorans]
MVFLDLLSHGFIQRALIAGSFIAILCAILGTFLVLRRFSLIGDGLAHVTFGGVAVGLFLRFYPMYVAVPIVMLSSLGILKLVEKARVYGDAAIGIVSSLGISVGILLASAAGGFNIDLFSYLFGNILSISSAEVTTSILLSVVLITVISLFYHELLAITFDEESAKATGVKTKTINTILVLLTSLTVVLAMRVVGIMLISALLILPPVTALQVTRGFRKTIFTASLAGVLSVVLGVFISFMADLPTGATIVVVNFLFFVCAFIINTRKRRFPSRDHDKVQGA